MRILSIFYAAIFAIILFSCSKADESPQPDTDLFVPSAFTPDGDGVNDSFIVKGTDIIQYHIEIFDEAKTPLYVSDSLNLGWDGKYKNQPVPAGNYLWVIDYTKNGYFKRKETGYVELIR